MDSQLDAIKTSELDKEIMLTLRASTTAMKKAGIGVAVSEAESMMGELDEHIKEVEGVTSVLANPLNYADDDADELDAELAWLEETPLLERDTKPIPARPRPTPIIEPPKEQGARMEPVAE